MDNQDAATEDVIAIRDLRKTFVSRGGVPALAGVSIDILRGELLVVLGASGCGKTTLLRTVAGLEEPTSGRISLFGRTVVDAPHGANVPPFRRKIGMVFQNYALWPHMTVKDNVAYPLRMRGTPKSAARDSAVRMLELLRCGHLTDRYPFELSGGQQQRVALGRSLVHQPEIVLFDEPLSNIDEQLRGEIRTEIRRLHNELRFTGIYVTHDQREGLEIGSRVAIMEAGRVVQLAPPEEIYYRPASAYVARFIGIENTVTCKVSACGVSCGAHRIIGNWSRLEARGHTDFEVMVRSQDLKLRTQSNASEPLAGTLCGIQDGLVTDIIFQGGETQTVVKIRDELFYSIEGSPERHHRVGEQVECYFDRESALIYPVADKTKRQTLRSLRDDQPNGQR